MSDPNSLMSLNDPSARGTEASFVRCMDAKERPQCRRWIKRRVAFHVNAFRYKIKTSFGRWRNKLLSRWCMNAFDSCECKIMKLVNARNCSSAIKCHLAICHDSCFFKLSIQSCIWNISISFINNVNCFFNFLSTFLTVFIKIWFVGWIIKKYRSVFFVH